MGERRMLTRKVTDDDRFINLPSSAQALYLHLSMCADDDGFCNQVTVCMFRAHATTADLQALLNNRFLLEFESGVIVIRHWRLANSLRKDRYSPTVYQEEFQQLGFERAGVYAIDPAGHQAVADGLPDGCQTVTQQATEGVPQVAQRLPKGCPNISKDKLSKDKLSKGGNAGKPRTPRKNLTEQNLEMLQGISDIPDHVRGLLEEWLTYKGQNKQGYSEQGLKMLVKRFLNNVSLYGLDAVREVVENSMSNEYKGITWDRLKAPRGNSNSNSNWFLAQIKKESNEQSGDNQGTGNFESGVPIVLPWAD